MNNSEAFNPLDKRNLGKSVSDALLQGNARPLGELDSFVGAGIYAIYNSGAFEPYLPISELNRNGVLAMPLYVGKAVPPGALKGSFGLDADPGSALSARLRQHAASIGQSDNLKIEDFDCRYLVVEDIWIPLGENLLIARFAPIWNKLIDGFGNHDPGSGRYKQVRSRWDVLHPGRRWAERLPDRSESARQISMELETYLRDLLR